VESGSNTTARGTTLNVYHSFGVTSKPSNPVGSLNINLASLFTNRIVYVGFTAATGGSNDNQEVG
jgi:hypothetical protein